MFERNGNGLFNADFLSHRATNRLLKEKFGGFCVNGKHCLSAEDSFRHLLVVGSTGSGKSTTVLIPSLLGLQHSAVVTDPSGELFALTSGQLQRRGFQIMTVNLGDMTQSLPFNPVIHAQSVTQIRQVAHLLVKAAFPNAANRDTFWNLGATNIIAIMMQLLVSQPTHFRNLANVKFLLDSFGQKGAELIDFVAKNADPDTYRLYKSFIVQSDNTLQSILSTAKVALEKLADPQLARLMSGPSLDLEQLRRRKTVLYLIVPEQSLEYYSFVLTLLYAQLFDMAMQPLVVGKNTPIFFLLDEFANSGIGYLDNFNKIITTIRKRKCGVLMVVQNLQQMTGLFGQAKAASIIDGGCASHLFLSGQSLATAEQLERRLGRTSMSVENSQGHTSQTARALLTSDEIIQLPKDQALLFHANLAPILLKMRPFYQQRALQKATALPPAVLLPSAIPGPVKYVSL